MVKYPTQSNIIKSIFALLIISILFNACQQVSTSTNQANINNEKSLILMRFEQDLFNSNPDSIENTLQNLKQKYTTFFDVYFMQIMNFGSPKTPGFPLIVKDYIQNEDFKLLVSDCDSIHNEEKVKVLTNELSTVLQNYAAIYPNDTLPQVTTFISGFGNAIITTDGYIGIGLDLFLGANYRFYPSLDLPDYLIKRYTPNHLLPMFAKGIGSYKYPLETEKPLLIDIMINEGKMLYFMDQLLPDVNDTLKIGYTNEQYNWSVQNEANIYQLLIQDGLFNSDFLKYRKYTDEAPFTVNLTNDSAPRIAWFCGWQIVKNFMKNNPQYSLDDLMREKDSQKILSSSKYKP